MSIKEARKRASVETRVSENPHPYVVPALKVRNLRVRVAIDFMNANFHRRISLAELADVAHLSPSHLSHLFKTHTGVSPGEYLRRLRMEKARHLLATSLLSIKEIMAMAGYNHKSHFVRHFRRSFGLAPSEYRKRFSNS
ncbi:MAG: helix-turn-helix domain-containing protein [Blastocatellia bacterium]